MKYHLVTNYDAAYLSYLAVYDRMPSDGFISKTGISETNIIDGIEKDIHLKDEWIKILNNIKNIKILSTCEGHNKLFLAHIIFQVTDETKDLSKIRTKLNITANELRGTKAIIVRIDNKDYFVVAVNNWWRQEQKFNVKWERWWRSISQHIYSAVNI